jgi:signal transduction histidine kinase
MMLPDFRVRQRDYLLEIARALTEELDLDKLLGRILKIALEMMAGQAGLIALRGSGEGWRLAATDGLAVSFIRFLEPLLKHIPDQDDPAASEIPAISRIINEVSKLATFGLLTGVGLPLVARGNVIGVIFIFRSYQGVFSSNDRTLLKSFANQAAIAVANAQLYQQVKEEKHRLDGILESAADGILILTPQLIISLCNPSFSAFSQKPIDEITSRNHAEIVQWAKPPQGTTLEKAMEGGWPLSQRAYLYVEGDLVRPEPYVPLPIGITYAPLLNADGGLLNIIATVRDITRFREADELKSTFISIISHELKTPVALIKGYAGTLRRKDADWNSEIVDDSLTVIEEEADRLTMLIEDLLDSTRLQSGALKLKKTDISIPDMVEHLIERLKHQTKVHLLSTKFPQDFPVILADEQRLRQVISNLITNSIKYAPTGEIIIHGKALADEVIISVSDDGPGIEATDIPHVFDRFYRSPESARKTKGAGLGLYLARSIVEAHGGRIWVEQREENRGVRISFSLPR